MDLPRRASGWPFAGVGEEGPSQGQLLAGLGQGGAVAMPLGGGVLTRSGARTSSRGPATAPLLPRSTAFESLSVRSLGFALRCEESCEEREEQRD